MSRLLALVYLIALCWASPVSAVMGGNSRETKGTETTILNQVGVAANTVYTSSAASMADYNGYHLTVSYSGTGDANLNVFVFPSNDCSTAGAREIFHFYVLSPRSGATNDGFVTGWAGQYKCLIVAAKTEATIPGGSPTIVVKFQPLNLPSVPNYRDKNANDGAMVEGMALFGQTRGTWHYAVSYAATIAAGNCVFAIWNPSGAVTEVVIKKIMINSSWNSGTPSTTFKALNVVRLSADPSGISAITPQSSDRVFLAPLATIRSTAAGGAACTNTGQNYLQFPLSFSQNAPFNYYWDNPHGDSLDRITIRGNEGMGFQLPVAATATDIITVNILFEEEN
jgi:hypothetical protein